MLRQARKRPDIDWVLGDLSSARWHHEFDLVVMTGHAFQVLTGDDQLRTALAAIHAALTEDGRFVFETRNPAVRPWERWTPDRVTEVNRPDGTPARVWQELERPVSGDLAGFTETFDSPARAASSCRTAWRSSRWPGPAFD